MPKCEYCGNETNFPFRCSQCGKVFCAKHRIAESHECQYTPQERIPLSAPRYGEPTLESLGRCPDCNTYALNELYFDADTMTFECKIYGRKWTQLKREPHKIIETREKEREKTTQQKKKHWFF